MKPIFFWFIYYFNFFFCFSFFTLFSLWLRYFYRITGLSFNLVKPRLKKSLVWFYTFENLSFKSIKMQFFRFINLFCSLQFTLIDESRLSPIDFWFHYKNSRNIFFFHKIWKRRYNKVCRFYNLFQFNSFVTRRVGGWKWRLRRWRFERLLKKQLLKTHFNISVTKFYKTWMRDKRVFGDVKKSSFVHSRLGKVLCIDYEKYIILQ